MITSNPTLPSAAPCHILKGKPIADEILGKVAQEVSALARGNAPLRLVSVTFGDPAAAAVYVRNQSRAAARVGIEFIEATFPETTDEIDALVAIEALDADPNVTGIILQRPLPRHFSTKRLQGAIRPEKDVEGMHPDSIGQIVYGLSDIGPCTAQAAVEMLRRTGLSIKGLEVVVIGHSEIVGKPIAFLLMAEGATVTVCHHMTRSVFMHSRRADALFVAVGKSRLVGADMVKPGAAVIDIGINPTVGTDGSPRVVGDVDFGPVSEIAGWLTPVPGGVGPVTLAVLMRNTVFAARRQRLHNPNRSLAAVFVPGRFDERIVIRDLEVMACVGIYPHEVSTPQPLRVNLELAVVRGGTGHGIVDYEAIVRKVVTLAANGHVNLVEEFAGKIVELIFSDRRIRKATVRVEKTNAVAHTSGVGVEITRVAPV